MVDAPVVRWTWRGVAEAQSGGGRITGPLSAEADGPRERTCASLLTRYNKHLNTFIPHTTIGIRSYLHPYVSYVY